jgi:E3 ubiquitin-protein ligase TRIP12
MHRAIPIGNKQCAKREEQRRHQFHRDRVKNMRPQVDTKEPKVLQFDHIRNNLKREQMLEERYTQIDRENMTLLKKMSDIMKHPTFSVPKEVKGPVSLNRDFRKAELIRITKENQAILKRIQSAQPIYNHVEWEEAHNKNEHYLRNCCEYPITLPSRKGYGESGLMSLGAQEGMEQYQESQQKLEQYMEEDRKLAAEASNAAKEATAEEELRYVLKEGKKIGEGYYLVEMATDGRTMTISAYDGDTQKTLELLVNEKNHRKLYRESNGDYSAIASRLRVDGDRLILDPAGGSAYQAPASAQAPSEISADDMVVRRQDISAGSVGVDLDVNSEGGANVHVRGFTPSTPSAYSPDNR